jgi:hypothetical protein
MQNAFIGCKPGHILLKKVIGEILNNVNNNYYGDTSLDITGPYLLGKVFQNNKNVNYKLGAFKTSDTYKHGYFEIDNKVIISHKDNPELNNNYKSTHYTDSWKNRDVYNFNFIKESFGNGTRLNNFNDICILLTTCVNIKTSYNNKYNTPRVRLDIYKDVIDQWLKYTDFDIKIVESSDYQFNEYKNNPRIEIYSFRSKSIYNCQSCEATPYEAESILLAFKNLNLEKYNKIIKVTGKYYLPGFAKLVNNIPSDADVFFQYTEHPEYEQQNSEFFGCRTEYLQQIMYYILENSLDNLNFESSLYKLKSLNKYKIYRFPKIKLKKPVLRSGDSSYIYEL